MPRASLPLAEAGPEQYALVFWIAGVGAKVPGAGAPPAAGNVPWRPPVAP